MTGTPTSKVLIRAQIKERDAILNKDQEFCMYHMFLCKIETKTVNELLAYSEWVNAMQAELAEFERNKVQRKILIPPNVSVIGLKWELTRVS